MMAVAVVEQCSGTQAVSAGVVSGCNRLGGSIPRPAGGTCGVGASCGYSGSLGEPDLRFWKNVQLPTVLDWAEQFPEA